MVREALLEPLPEERAAAGSCAMEGELRADEAAAAYEALLRETLGNHPRLDLVLLGLGPGRAHRVAVPRQAGGARSTSRLVVGVPEPRAGAARAARDADAARSLNAAREVVFLVSGADKAEAVAARVRRPARPVGARRARAPAAPATLTVVLDAAAAAELSR